MSRQSVHSRRFVPLLVIALVASALATNVGAAPTQNDAGSGGDAGDSFDSATPVTFPGAFTGRVDRYNDDTDDYYRFFLDAGASLTLTLVAQGATLAQPAEILDPNGVLVDAGLPGLGSLHRNLVRLEVQHALVAGEYRLHVAASLPVASTRYDYSVCAEPCVDDVPQSDAGSGGDAGDALAEATRVEPSGRYYGYLVGSGVDDDDYYKFRVEQGESINVEIKGVLQTGSLVAGDNQRRLSFQLQSPQGVLLDTPNTNNGDARVTLVRAPVAGDYVLRVTAEHGFSGSYGFCFLPPACPDFGIRPTDLIFGGALRHADVSVLLVPPAHGDLGNPFGPTVTQYLDTTLAAMHKWEDAMDRFADDYPQYAYLREITIDVEIFDEANPVDPAGYDVIITYAPYTGPLFRGIAGQDPSLQSRIDELGYGNDVHDGGRRIVLSLFASSPRAGQMEPDYPELSDLYTVTLHEFAHTFGLGHTATWTHEHGADLMNSPATFVYGDGSAVLDGEERTPFGCISTINLYGMAVLYRWIPSGQWVGSGGSVWSPLPYALYC